MRRILVVLAVVVVGCSGSPEVAERTSAPSPTPAVRTPLPAPEPFEVVLDHIEMIAASNAEIVGVAPPAVDEAEVELAADRARRVLQRYLDAQFVAQGTRFSTSALHDLLTPSAHAALTPADRRGLGALHLAVDHVATGPASATAEVMFDGPEVQLVTLTYSAELKVGFDGRPPTLPLTQQGSLTYVPTEAGWRVAAADVDLVAPQRPPPPMRVQAQ